VAREKGGHAVSKGPAPTGPHGHYALHPAFSPWYLLLLAPFIAVLWPAFYFRAEPVVWGIPYFYFYQFIWLLISAALTAVIYKITQREPGR
jgi:hypothetical protein